MPTLVVLAAGISSRFGGGKQLAPVGPHGEALFDYAIFDALRKGYRQIALVIRKDAQREFETHMTDTWGNDLTVRYALQEAPRLPRQRPWGTGHAILSARNAVSGPFAVVNAGSRCADYLGSVWSLFGPSSSPRVDRSSTHLR